MSRPQILFGCSQLGANALAAETSWRPLLQWLVENGVTRFDSAALYPYSSPGKSEETLGRFQAADSASTLHIDSKILVTTRTGKDTLTTQNIHASASASRDRLGSAINVLYCHAPDPVTPLHESVSAFKELRAKGVFKDIGLSNFDIPRIQSLIATCADLDTPGPRVFQGQYNALCRNAEKSLLPFLRERGIAYIAYSPLAGGFLTGKPTAGLIAGTRFDKDFAPIAEGYRNTYDRPEMHQAVRLLETACAQHAVDLPHASLRWLMFHSALREGDGFILGATKPEQVRANLESLRQNERPLPAQLIEAFDKAWRVVEAVAPP